jgi:hypothetical protein
MRETETNQFPKMKIFQQTADLADTIDHRVFSEPEIEFPQSQPLKMLKGIIGYSIPILTEIIGNRNCRVVQ